MIPRMLHHEAVSYLLSLPRSTRVEWLTRYGLLWSGLAREVLGDPKGEA